MTAGGCPEESDTLFWDSGCSWLSGDECNGVWVDRSYGVDDPCLSACPQLESVLFIDRIPSEGVLLSGIDYLYQRPQGRTTGQLGDDGVFFVADCIDGSDVIDSSGNSNDGTII